MRAFQVFHLTTFQLLKNLWFFTFQIFSHGIYAKSRPVCMQNDVKMSVCISFWIMELGEREGDVYHRWTPVCLIKLLQREERRWEKGRLVTYKKHLLHASEQLLPLAEKWQSKQVFFPHDHINQVQLLWYSLLSLVLRPGSKHSVEKLFKNVS